MVAGFAPDQHAEEAGAVRGAVGRLSAREHCPSANLAKRIVQTVALLARDVLKQMWRSIVFLGTDYLIHADLPQIGSSLRRFPPTAATRRKHCA